MSTGGSWAVLYNDGTGISQFDSSSEHFLKGPDEVPYRAIDWSKAQTVVLASEYVETRVDIGQASEGYRPSLRSRHFRTAAGETVMCFMIIESKIGEEVSDESVISAFYWLPDGSQHTCNKLNCPDVSDYAGRWVNGVEGKALMPASHELRTEIGAAAEQ